MAIEIIDLLSSEDDSSFKRSREESSDNDVMEVAPPSKQQVQEAIILLDSEQPSTPPLPHSPPPIERELTVNYTSLVPGSRGTGSFKLKVNDTFQEFSQKFCSNIDDIEIRGTDASSSFTTSWYGTPEIFLIDEPDAEEVKVIVVSKEAGSDVEEEEEEEKEEANAIFIRINTPAGRLEIRVRPDHTIKELVNWVSAKQKVDAKKIKVEFDSDEVTLKQTIEDLDLEDEDLLDMRW